MKKRLFGAILVSALLFAAVFLGALPTAAYADAAQTDASSAEQSADGGFDTTAYLLVGAGAIAVAGVAAAVTSGRMSKKNKNKPDTIS